MTDFTPDLDKALPVIPDLRPARINVSTRQFIRDRLEAEAAARGVTLSYLIGAVLEHYFSEFSLPIQTAKSPQASAKGDK